MKNSYSMLFLVLLCIATAPLNAFWPLTKNKPTFEEKLLQKELAKDPQALDLKSQIDFLLKKIEEHKKSIHQLNEAYAELAKVHMSEIKARVEAHSYHF